MLSFHLRLSFWIWGVDHFFPHKLKINALKRESRQANDIEQERNIQEQIQKAEKEKRRMRQQIFDVEDEITEKRDALIDALEQRLHRKSKTKQLFTVFWKIT